MNTPTSAPPAGVASHHWSTYVDSSGASAALQSTRSAAQRDLLMEGLEIVPRSSGRPQIRCRGSADRNEIVLRDA